MLKSFQQVLIIMDLKCENVLKLISWLHSKEDSHWFTACDSFIVNLLSLALALALAYNTHTINPNVPEPIFISHIFAMTILNRLIYARIKYILIWFIT